MRTYRAGPVSAEVHELAEGPVWEPSTRRLLWVDIQAASVLEGHLHDGRIERTARHDFAGTVGAAVRSEDGRMLVAAHHDLVLVDETGDEVDRRRLVPPGRDSRCNDGGCDPAGRFLIGTMALDDREGQEGLYRLERDGSLTVLDDDLTLSNGLAWSPDGRRFYNIDSVARTVWSRDYDVATGRVGPREVLLRIDGTPDGMCADADGNLWVAIFDAGEVRAYTPDGEHVATVDVGVPNPTSVAFVDDGLASLLITTARHELSPSQRSAHPDSGRLFLADVGTRGLPVAAWDGSWLGGASGGPTTER